MDLQGERDVLLDVFERAVSGAQANHD